MKGMIFTQLLEMIEDQFSPELADRIIGACDLPSGGAYTAVGTYDHHEMGQLVTQLSQETGIAVPDLLRSFGKHLFGRFVATYPHFFVGIQSAFGFLESIERYIHVEVRKLYPNAELPSFTCTSQPGQLTMVYRSPRAFADLAEGLIRGCTEHFGEHVEIQRDDLSGGQGTCVRFVLTKRG
jgi:Haem-NO-binding